MILCVVSATIIIGRRCCPTFSLSKKKSFRHDDGDDDVGGSWSRGPSSRRCVWLAAAVDDAETHKNEPERMHHTARSPLVFFLKTSRPPEDNRRTARRLARQHHSHRPTNQSLLRIFPLDHH